MKRLLLVLSLAAIMAAVMAASALTAFAAATPAANPNSKSEGSTVGQASSLSTHNGGAVREQKQERSDLVQACNAQESPFLC